MRACVLVGLFVYAFVRASDESGEGGGVGGD